MVAGRTHIPVLDRTRCNACMTCMRACPLWVLRGLEAEKDSLRAAVARRVLFPAVESGMKHLEAPPCVAACPLGQDVPAYLAAVAAGDSDGALKVILDTNPLPSVLGRVCMHPCTRACIRASLGSPPDIRGLKHYAAEACGGFPLGKAAVKPGRGGSRRVAVVGSGPAGLAAAGCLAGGGFQVTVYEKRSEPGGMLRYGLGDFDLPLQDLDRDLERIMSLGVNFRTGVEIGSMAALEREGADAVLIATGAAGPGSTFEHAMAGLEGVEHAAAFAESVRLGKIKSLPHHVVVEGHGPWAVTAARMALRLGAAKVSLLVPAALRADELESGPFAVAAAEGVAVLSPVRVAGLVHRAGRLAAVECLKLGYGRRDVRGRALGETRAGSLKIRAGRFIEAMDRRPRVEWLLAEGGVRPGLEGTVAVHETTLMTGRRNLFAAGDVVTGPRSVISAVAMGVRAARAIMKVLEGGGR